MAITEFQAFVCAVAVSYQNATAYTRYNDFYQPIYGVRFSNGHTVEGSTPFEAREQARVYATSVFRLTGRYP